MNGRLFINLHPGTTFLDRLTGKNKVRLFLLNIVILIATWDFRVILPLSVLYLAALFSIRPSWKRIWGLVVFVVAVNLFNLFLMWLVEPDYGASIVGGSTVLLRLNGFYVFTRETLWYFLVRFMKFMSTFLVSLVFIQTITPSELAAGLYALKIPYKVCFIVELAFRYIPDIARDFASIRISMQARGTELDSRKAGLLVRLKQNVLILVPLLITSFDRIGNIANAMDLRGFGKGKKRTYYCEHEDGKEDRIVSAVIWGLLVFLAVLIGARLMHADAFQVWSPWY